MKKYIIAALLYGIVPALTGTLSLRAQSPADTLRKVYDFPAAVEWCRNALASADSSSTELLENELILSENGLNMMSYCSQPAVVARYMFSLKDFFLYYPMENRSWRATPNQLDSIGKAPFVNATYIPERAAEIYYSAADGEGISNIYRTSLRDSLWTVPELINESVTSSSNEIFPIISGDRKAMYFASEGLYGMGGYDLYVSYWNEKAKDWDAPVNMGFPYSSPYDDFLYINTDDGKYSIFASNRECSDDSVFVYVLEYDDMPVRKAVESVQDLRTLASLAPQEDPSKMNTSSAVSAIETEDSNIREYMEKMAKVRELRDSISIFKSNLDNLRAQLGADGNAENTALKDEILNKEIALPGMQNKLDLAVKDLQKTEMEFLMSGVAINPDKLRAEADREVVGAASNYALSRKELGPDVTMKFEEVKPSFDYTFKLLDEGQFAEDNTLPEGLIYQIQLFVTSRKATVAQLNGLSPVFERPNGGNFVYTTGLFKSYSDVLSHLNTVKKQGFKTAMIVAFRDGVQMSVAAARTLEASIHTLYKLHIFPENGHTLSEEVINVIRQSTDKDIIRLLEEGKAVYEIGIFDSKEQCENLQTAVNALGESNTEIITAGKSMDE